MPGLSHNDDSFLIPWKTFGFSLEFIMQKVCALDFEGIKWNFEDFKSIFRRISLLRWKSFGLTVLPTQDSHKNKFDFIKFFL